MEKTVSVTVIVVVALVVILISYANYLNTATRIAAFHSGYCQVMLPGSQNWRWQRCP